MDSESSQDTFYFLTDGEKDLMAYEEEEMLALEQSHNSTIAVQSGVIIPENNASTTKRGNFSLLMSAIDYFTSSENSLASDEPKLIGAAATQPDELEPMDTIGAPTVDFVSEDGIPLALPDIPMPLSSEAVPHGAGADDMSTDSPRELTDLDMVSQKDDLKSAEHNNALQQSNVVHVEPSQPPEEVPQLYFFENELILIDSISLWGITVMPVNCIPDQNQKQFVFNEVDVACRLLEAVVPQMGGNVIVFESTVMAIAKGLQLSIGNKCEVDDPMNVRNGIGNIAVDILLDSESGVVQAFAVARLMPRLITNASGIVQGVALHQVIRGFTIDENSRRIISEALGFAIP